MAIPTSPSVVVRENDVSIYTPSINSSVVGIVGFATKGPVNKATLITSQANLLKTFGRPDTALQSQAIEGANEILEATNQLYFVRGIDPDKVNAYASANGVLGACPAVEVSGYVVSDNPSSIYYSVTNNDGTLTVTSIIDVVSSTTNNTAKKIFENSFNPELLNQQNVFAYVEGGSIFLASRFAGSGASLQVSATGLKFEAIDINGDASATGDASNLTVQGYTASDINVVFKSQYPGTSYNLSTLNDGSVRGVSVEVNNLSVRDQVVINNEGAEAESFNALELSPSSNNSIEYVLNEDIDYNQSDYVFAEILSGTTAYVPPNQFGAKLTTSAGFAGFGQSGADATPRFLKLVEGTYGLANGENGGLSATDLIGSKTEKTGIYCLDDDGLNISIAAIPGVTDQTVQNALVTLAEESKNFLALVSPPYGLGEVQDAVNWINGADADARTAAINSSYAAVYWPWVQVFNSAEGAEQWYDPSIFAACQCVFTDAVSEPWFAPAGFRRGRLTKPTATEIPLNQGDRDTLYSNSINPITNDRVTGITIFGQRTTQRTPTALDRVNVRRLMIYIRKVLLDLGKPFQFEPNDQFTWELVEDTINPFLEDLLARRAIVEGRVTCDSTTNTPLRVDRNELWCSVTIKPVKAAETIVFEVNLTSQSATIN
jgi:phage tail sheath protein FI